jgi:hypothetical protein
MRRVLPAATTTPLSVMVVCDVPRLLSLPLIVILGVHTFVHNTGFMNSWPTAVSAQCQPP